MVDALSRLFGKGSKKSSSSSTSSPSLPGLDSSPSMPTVENSADDGFTLINPAPNVYPSIHVDNSNGYNNIPDYQLRPATLPETANNSNRDDNSGQESNVLDRIEFTLSPRLRLGESAGVGGREESEEKGVHVLLEEAETLVQQVSDLLHESHVDFRLEKGVVDSDITDTMRKMNTH